MTAIWHALARGAAAGAAGTGARLACGLLDPAARCLRTPGRLRRLAADTVTGVAIGASTGALRAAGVRLPAATGGPLLAVAGLAATGGLAALRDVADPRRWRAVDWTGEVVPQIAFGLTTHQTLVTVSRVAEGREQVPPARRATLVRAAALGAASGARTSAGLTAVALTSARNDPGLIASRLGSPAANVALGLLAILEVIGDKRAAAPSRLEATPLLLRIAAGATAAGSMARRDHDDPALPAVIGIGTAALAAVAGNRLRAAAARRLGSDKPGALVEDAIAGLLSWCGARR